MKGIFGIVLDLADVIVGSVPVVGDVLDIANAGYCTLVWGGRPSIIPWAEALIPESEILGAGTVMGAMIPSCTIAAIMAPDQPKTSRRRQYYG